MSRLIGKSKHNDQRKPLLLRVGTKNRPTFDLIADGILGEQSHEYQPKLDVRDKSSDLGKSVAERIKSLRQRTLTKISSDTSVDENAFSASKAMERLSGVVSLLVIEALRLEPIMPCSRNKKCITIVLTSRYQ